MKWLYKAPFVLSLFILTGQTHLVRSAEVTFDASYYYYEEPNFMNDTSDPVFISLGLRDWDLLDVAYENPWNFVYTAEVTRGWVHYNGSGTLDKDYYKFRGEAYAGYQFGNLMPIIGLGYRWLYDDSGGVISSTGAVAYDRRSQYLYLPVGAIVDVSEALKIKGQFNYLLKGRQTSYLSTASSLYTDIDNTQSSGWGVDFTIDYKINDRTSLYTFYRYWDIDRSETATGTFAGIIKFEGVEPANTTVEAGIGISLHF